MEKLIEFLNECKHNRDINKKEDLHNVIDLDYVIERLEDILGKTLTCNMCGSTDVSHEEYNGTHIYVCEDCPNVQFEFISNTDLDNLINKLRSK